MSNQWIVNFQAWFDVDKISHICSDQLQFTNQSCAQNTGIGKFNFMLLLY